MAQGSKELRIFVASLHTFCRTIDIQPAGSCIRQATYNEENGYDDEKRNKRMGPIDVSWELTGCRRKVL